MNKFSSIFSLVLLGVGMQSFAAAVGPTAPEIDPASAGSAIALLAGAIVVIRGRRK